MSAARNQYGWSLTAEAVELLRSLNPDYRPEKEHASNGTAWGELPRALYHRVDPVHFRHCALSIVGLESTFVSPGAISLSPVTVRWPPAAAAPQQPDAMLRCNVPLATGTSCNLASSAFASSERSPMRLTLSFALSPTRCRKLASGANEYFPRLSGPRDLA